VENLSERGSRVRRLIHSLEFPREIVEEVVKAYRKLCKEYGEVRMWRPQQRDG